MGVVSLIRLFSWFLLMIRFLSAQACFWFTKLEMIFSGSWHLDMSSFIVRGFLTAGPAGHFLLL